MSEPKDVHSFSKPEEVAVTHLSLTLFVDFNTKILDGVAEWRIDNKTGEDAELILDINGLDVTAVQIDGKLCDFVLGKPYPFLGRPLIIEVFEGTKTVTVFYKTSPSAAAVQWLAPEQTAGKIHPFLFTQSEAILARTWIPCQDSPGVRFTYDAKVKVPKGYLALMSAENPQEINEKGYYSFRMPHAMPSYLMSLAAGHISYSATGSLTGVYAEPVMLERSVFEFAEMEDMLHAAEKLYGPYPWGRYDLIVLPPSFPFGGMENPCLTFATPTILAGDRSLTSIVAHELAHSWSGNLVTNATWNDFWLNEGFTVYFERRIMEALYGKDYADMLAVLGREDLNNVINDLGADNPDTCLKLDLVGRDPDDGMTQIAYEKGFFFLLLIEKTMGRERFDAFLIKYFKTFAFHSMDTERFLLYILEDLFENDTTYLEQIDVQGWVYSPGLPANIPVIKSSRFEAVHEAIEKWESGIALSTLNTQNWSAHEWIYFIKKLPSSLNKERMAELDAVFRFTQSKNSEITAAWLIHAVNHHYEPAYNRLEEFLVEVGRRKFIVPLYKALCKTHEGKKLAQEIYAKARPGYHSVASGTIDEIVK